MYIGPFQNRSLKIHLGNTQQKPGSGSVMLDRPFQDFLCSVSRIRSFTKHTRTHTYICTDAYISMRGVTYIYVVIRQVIPVMLCVMISDAISVFLSLGFGIEHVVRGQIILDAFFVLGLITRFKKMLLSAFLVLRGLIEMDIGRAMRSTNPQPGKSLQWYASPKDDLGACLWWSRISTGFSFRGGGFAFSEKRKSVACTEYQSKRRR